MLGDDPTYTGMDISAKSIVCTTLDENGNIVRKDSIEKAFRILQTDQDIFPMRVRKESTIRGMLFIFFISLIIRTALIRGMVSSGLMRKYSLEKMILELEKLHVVEDDRGNITELERTRKQMDILYALEKVSWW